MKGKLISALVTILLSLVSRTQAATTISLPTLSGTAVGNDVTVPVNIVSSDSIGGMTIQIQYDPTVLFIKNCEVIRDNDGNVVTIDCPDVTKGPRAGTLNIVPNPKPTLISTNPPTLAGVRIVFFGPSSVGSPNGILLNLKFRVASIGSSPIIVTACDVNDTVCSPTPQNGSFTTDICSPAPNELCNGQDDNCNDQIDDGFDIGASCFSGVGACQRSGVKICSENGAGTVCNATPGSPTTETCNGADDDCNNQIDNGFDVGADCSVGSGACQRNGVKVCTGDGVGTACNAVAGEPGVEGPFGAATCSDSIDNDCDRAIDALDPDCLAPGLSDLIPGNGSIETDCMTEWKLENVTLAVNKKGIPLNKQSCSDGAACDADGAANGNCTFQVSACLNIPDDRLTDRQGAPACLLSDVALIDPVDIPDPLITKLTNLGGQERGLCANRGIKKGNLCQQDSECDTEPGKGNGKCKGKFVAFSPSLTAQICTPSPVSIDVPLKTTPRGALKKGAVTLKTNTLSSPQGERLQRVKDSDSLQLICLPPAE